MPRRPSRPHLGSCLIGAGLALVLALTAACGGDDRGAGTGGDDPASGTNSGAISEDQAVDAANRFLQASLGLFTGATDAGAFIELFAPECREGVDESGLQLALVLIQSFAGDLRGTVIEEVDVGEVRLEQTSEGTLVSPVDPSALRVKVNGDFISASELFASAGFEETGGDEPASPILLVQRQGQIYAGDCSELEGLIGSQPQ